MTVFDILVLSVIAIAAIAGLFRGLLEQLLSLAALVGAVLLIGVAHEPTVQFLTPLLDNASGASLLAYIFLFIIGFLVMNWAAKAIGKRSRASFFGPMDRVLGLGFGAIKGILVATLVFLLIVLVHEYLYGSGDRPDWLAEGRTYPLLNACGDLLVDYLGERQSGTG